MSKILIIGQAPPFATQSAPYDTTMLYDWFLECGISKEAALSMFDFDAIYNKFPGFNSNGGHLSPTDKQADEYWPTLKLKISTAKKLIVLGNTAKKYLTKKGVLIMPGISSICVIHPSRRNAHLYKMNKQEIIQSIQNIIK